MHGHLNVKYIFRMDRRMVFIQQYGFVLPLSRALLLMCPVTLGDDSRI